MRALALIAAMAAPCMPVPVTNHAPPRTVEQAFSLLGRPATPADRWQHRDLLPSDATFFQRAFRLAGSHDGYKFFLLPAQGPQCGTTPELFIGADGPIPTVQGGATLNQVKRFGEWIAQGSSSGSIVAGLLPNGVAKVTVTYPAGRQHPGGVNYPRAVHKTVRVRGNFALFTLGRPPDDASSPSHQVWRNKSGKVIRRTRGNP